MKREKFVPLFLFVVILLSVLVVTVWCYVLPEDVKCYIQKSRWRRNLNSPQAPDWMERMIRENSNKSLHRTSENVLLNALGQLQISGPENVMTYITKDSPCKELKPSLKIFQKYQRDLPETQLYARLFRAVRKFYFLYCGKDEQYRKLLSRFQDDLKAVHEQFKDCEGSPDWFDILNSTKRCDEANEVLNCNYETLKSEIGTRAAKAYNCIFKVVLEETMIQTCNLTSVTVESTGSSNEFKATILFFTSSVIFLL